MVKDGDGAAVQLVLAGWCTEAMAAQLVDQSNYICKEWCSIN
jgi:hypothetical protein